MEDICFDFKQLQTFIAVIETRSFTAAAEKLAQTQSSVSQQIATLEKSLNAQLLDRSKRPVQLTVAGQDFYQSAIKLLDEGKQLQERIHVIKEGQVSSLKLGIVDSLVQTIGLDVLKLLRPKVKRISQFTGAAPDLLKALLKGEINAALTMLHTDLPSSIQVYPLMTEEYLIVSPRDWGDKSLEALCRQHDYIAYASWTPTGSQTLNWLKWRKLQPNIQFEVERADDILRLIASGYGWTLTTPLFLMLAPSILTQLKMTPLPSPGLTRKLALICKDGEFNNFCKTLAIEVENVLLNAVEISALRLDR